MRRKGVRVERRWKDRVEEERKLPRRDVASTEEREVLSLVG